jgi:hypothetical protein
VQAILAKVRQVSRSHIVHRGRDIFPAGITSVDPSKVAALSASNDCLVAEHS